MALVLEANPSLTWRDVQYLIVETSQPRNLKTTDWQTNGIGRKVSHHYGYGLMDAGLFEIVVLFLITLNIFL